MTPTPRASSPSDILLTMMPDDRPSGSATLVLGGLYRLEKLIAKGGMGLIYEATHLRMGGRVAIKFLGDGHRTDSDVLRRFREEAQILGRLKHPHIITILDAGDDPEQGPFQVTELLSGQDLEAYLWAHGPLSFTDARHVALQAGGALQAAHDLHIVHRDIKPQNLFIVNTGSAGTNPLFLKVIDFGVSKMLNRMSGERTAPMTAIGTPQYMAPETARGQASEADGRSDQFSLAVVLYRALSGSRPFDAPEAMAVLWQVVNCEPPPLGALVPGIPLSAAQAIHRALSKDPADRFESMAAFVRAFAQPDSSTSAVGASLSCPATLITRPPLSMLALTHSSQSSVGAGAAESKEPELPTSGSSRLGQVVTVVLMAMFVLSGSSLLLSRRNALRGQLLVHADRLVGIQAGGLVVRLVPMQSEEASSVSTAPPREIPCAVPSVACVAGSGLSERDRTTVFKLLRRFKLGVCAHSQAVIYKALDGKTKVKVMDDSNHSLKWRRTDVESFWNELAGSMEYGRELPDIIVDGPGRGSCVTEKSNP